jgi:outer membrane protein insertion porin family
VIEGTVHVDPAEIAKVIQIKAGQDYRVGLQVLLRDDVRRIMSLGYFIDANVERDPVPGGMRLIYHVYEKPILVGMRFVGNKELSDKKLRQHLGWDEKSRVFMDKHRSEAYRKSLLQLYEDRAYPRTTIATELEDQETPFETVAVFTITEGKQLPLRRLTFEGNKEYSDRQIRKRIKTKPTWLIFKRDYVEVAMKEDLKIIRNMYVDRGYLDAEVTQEGPVEEEKGLGVTIKIVEGARYRLGQTSVVDNQIFSNDEILSQFTLKEGEFYSEGTVQKDLLSILNLYRNQGYYFTRVGRQLAQRSEEAIVDVTIAIREAERLHFGSVEIQGVTRMKDTQEIIPLKPEEFSTKDYVILREVKLKPGDVLDWSKILDADRRLVNLRYFKSREFPVAGTLNLNPGFSDPLPREDDPTVADLLLQLEEVQTGAVMFGGSYNTTFGPGAFVQLDKRNLFGRGKDLSTILEFGKIRDRLSVQLMEPYLLGTEYSLDTELRYRNIDPYGGRMFSEESIGLQTTLSHPFLEHSRYFIGLRAQESDVSVEERRLEVVRVPDLYDSGQNTTTSLILGLARDTRDFRANPTRGTYNRATMELAGLADNNFVKIIGESNYYRSLTGKLVLALSGEADFAQPFGGDDFLPLQERFWIGGANSVRGFEEGTLTEHDTITRRRFYPALGIVEHTRDIWLGSEAAILGKAELRYPFFDILQGVVFIDSGAGYTEIGEIDPSELRFSAGVGIRVNLPIGAMIRLDYAVPLKTEPGDEEQNFQFSAGQAF